MHFPGTTADEARAFADRWLPAWTGNHPGRLAGFCTDDAFYADPAIPMGLKGREALPAYFGELRPRNPDWVWSHRDSIPLADGFLNFSRVSIPVGDRVVEVGGVCTVQLRDGLIYSNQVFFALSLLRRSLGSV